MVFSCQLCSNSEEYLFVSRFCSKCQKLKHYLSIYNDRVYEILDSVLSRDLEKQKNKINLELKNEIENKQYKLSNIKVKHIKKGSEEFIKSQQKK